MGGSNSTVPASFKCTRCGSCCRESGYVHVTDEEVDQIAAQFELGVDVFTERDTRLTHNRTGLSLTEQDDGACIFLSEVGECSVETVKPLQCREFPFVWRYKDVARICEGWRTDETTND